MGVFSAAAFLLSFAVSCSTPQGGAPSEEEFSQAEINLYETRVHRIEDDILTRFQLRSVPSADMSRRQQKQRAYLAAGEAYEWAVERLTELTPPRRYLTGHGQLSDFLQREAAAWAIKARLLRGDASPAETKELRSQLQRIEDGLVDLFIAAKENLPFLELQPIGIS